MTSILGISGGKKGGRVTTFLKEALAEAKKKGAATELVELADHHILPLTRVSDDPENEESLESTDDMPKLYEKILKADGIVFATPVNWFSPSSEMKVFIDRLTPLENAGFKLEGKVAGLIVYGNEAGRMNALMTMAAALNHMGMLLPPYAMIYFDQAERSWNKPDLKLLGKNMTTLIDAIKKNKSSFDYE